MESKPPHANHEFSSVVESLRAFSPGVDRSRPWTPALDSPPGCHAVGAAAGLLGGHAGRHQLGMGRNFPGGNRLTPSASAIGRAAPWAQRHQISGGKKLSGGNRLTPSASAIGRAAPWAQRHQISDGKKLSGGNRLTASAGVLGKASKGTIQRGGPGASSRWGESPQAFDYK
jgi:hypothetical protein